MECRELIFPNYFPCECPPENAEALDIIVFRLCKNNVLTEYDFKSYFELRKSTDVKDVRIFGLSVYDNIDTCLEMQRKLPQLRKLKCYAYGMTHKEDGKILKTPTSSCKDHYTWWLCKDTLPHTYFKGIQIEEGR